MDNQESEITSELIGDKIKITEISYIDVAEKINRRDNLLAEIARDQAEVEEINDLLNA